MKRIFGSLIVTAGVLCVGILPTLAAEPNPYAVVLAESEQTREQILIIVSPDSISHPFIQSFLSSYVQNFNEPLPLSSPGLRDADQNNRDAKPSVGTDVSNPVSGGTSSVRTTAEQPVMGTGGGVIYSPTTLQLIELYPNTSGDDAKEEYVVIKNTGEAIAPLMGWSLKDASGKTYVFKDGSIAPGSTLKLTREQSNLALNNDNDSVSIFSPSQQLIDSVSYENPKQGDLYLRQGTTWHFTSQVSAPQPEVLPTVPLEPVADEPVAPPKAETPKPAPEPESSKLALSKPGMTSVKAAKEKPDEVFVKISGTVTVLPSVLGKQFFYVEDETGGVQVFKHDANFPELHVGSVVTVAGEMSTSNNERRLKISKNGSIELNDSVAEPLILMKTIKEVTPALSGALIKTTGVLSNARPDHLELEEGGQKLEVAITSYTGIDTYSLTPGARLEITGIVRSLGEKVKLSPRSQDDIAVVQEIPPFIAGTVESEKTTQQKRDQTIATIVGAASGAALIIWIVRNHLRKKHETYVSHLAVTTETVH